MRYLLYMSILLVCTSCDITKQASKQKSDTEFAEQIESRITRVGDTVRYEVPNIIYRDTVIYTVNRQGTTLKTVYDQSGAIASIDCFASAIEEIRKENRQFQQSLKDKEKDKQENFNTDWILYIVCGIVLLVAIFLFLMFRLISQNAQILKTIQ